MTGQERDHGEVLSRVLHSTTDQVEPVGDGLTKIQARLAEPWLKRQWWLLRNECVILGWVLAVRCQSWFSTVRSRSAAGADADDAAAGAGGRLRSLPVLGGIVAWASAKRPRKAGAARRGSLGPAMTWFRPALAVAGAVVLVVAGVFALGQIRQTLASFENDNPPGTSTSSQTGGPGSTNGHGGRAVPSAPSTTQGNATSPRPSHSPSSTVTSSPRASASPSPSPGSQSPSPSPTSQSPSPTPTSTSPTPTPTTPTPTTTGTQAPMVTDTPTAGTPAGG
jgi:hypothetical protein